MSGQDITPEWESFRAELRLGQIVDGIVVEQCPFGVFVNIGSPQFLGVIELPNLEDKPKSKTPPFPAVGTRVRAVLTALGNPNGQQPRLSVRPSILRAAEETQRVAELPIEQRLPFLQEALQGGDGPMAVAAIQRLRYLPEAQQTEFLWSALRNSNVGIADAAVWQVADLPEEERLSFLLEALRSSHPGLGEDAVWNAQVLHLEEQLAFLSEASLHPSQEVKSRARWAYEQLAGHPPEET